MTEKYLKRDLLYKPPKKSIPDPKQDEILNNK